MKDNEVFIKTAEALLAEYTCVYFVETKTGRYRRFSSDASFREHTQDEGTDFFGDMERDSLQAVYEDDRDNFAAVLQRNDLLAAIKNGGLKHNEFRLITTGRPVWHTIRLIHSSGGDEEDDYYILGVMNTDTEVRERLEAESRLKERENYDRIAESLAANYDVIYYIDRDKSSYYGYVTSPLYGQLEIQEEGKDFFAEARRNISLVVHPNDRDRISDALDRDNLIPQLYRRKTFSLNYRIVVDGKIRYTRFTAMWSGDKKHIVIGVENIDSEVQKEKEHIKALNSEKELARRDNLTGTKNKTAYLELIRAVQNNIDNGIDYLTFAIVVCDINWLKEINDTRGHQAGDDYIRECAKLICTTFAHSPVFRVGGDEFVAFIRGGDYAFKDSLFAKLKEEVLANKDTLGKPVVAAGMSSYDPASDRSVTEVFERADKMMYENKRDLKGGADPR